MSERRACGIIGADRTTTRYRSKRGDDTALRVRLRELAQQLGRFGYPRLHILRLRRRDDQAEKDTAALHRGGPDRA